MTADVPIADPTLKAILDTVQSISHFDFWTATIIGLIGVFFSILAYREASKAKRAANAAGRTVKIQTVTIDLNELAQKLAKLDQL